MNYLQAQEYLENLNTRGIKPGLESVSLLAEIMGNPQYKLRFIHVAGTNAKGSVSTYISYMLKENGYCVGTYQTPAVFEDTEIIRINNRNVSQKLYAETVGEIKEALENHMDFKPTRFEVETVMAFLIFVKKNCDYVVLECGMGGLLDATNIVSNTEACVFAPIGMDHMAFLGDSLKAIAGNKAGIIKPGANVVSAGQQEAVKDVLIKAAGEKNCNITFADYSEIKKIKKNLKKTSFSYKGYDDVSISLLGKNQTENAALAIEAIEALKDRGCKIDEKKVLCGLHKATLPGRFEIISTKPFFVLDGAHNVPAAIRLKENILEYFNNKNIIFILAMLKDKEYDKVVQMMCPLATQVITATSPNRARALTAYELAQTVYETNNMVTNADSIDEAVEMALRIADKNSVIIAWGSLSHLKEVKRSLMALKKGMLDNHGIEG